MTIRRNGQTLIAKPIDYRQHLNGVTVVAAIADKIIRTDMVAVSGPEPRTGTIIEPQPTVLGLPFGHFGPLLPPNAFNALKVDSPSLRLQYHRDTRVALPPISG